LKDTAVLLFPHTTLAQPDLDRLLSCFGRLILCQPWFTEEIRLSAKNADPSIFRVIYPPVALKPRDDFKTLLSEYKQWVAQGQGKTHVSHLGALPGTNPVEPATWEIRGDVRRMRQKSQPKTGDDAFRWHIILHLAREWEENRWEEERILESLRQKGSPLEEALGDEPATAYFFKDLPPSSADLWDRQRLGEVFEAWFGLFGSVLPENESLWTLDPAVFDYAAGLFEDHPGIREKEEKETAYAESAIGPVQTTIQRFPRLTEMKSNPENPVIQRLSGRTLLLLDLPETRDDFNA
jgi:hypothetical protein